MSSHSFMPNRCIVHHTSDSLLLSHISLWSSLPHCTALSCQHSYALHTHKSLFLLLNNLLHVIIPSPCLFSFTLVSFSHFDLLCGNFSNASGHLHPHCVSITSFTLMTLIKNPLIQSLCWPFLSFHHFVLGTLMPLLR
jgi:hypothetical protein